MTRKFKVKITHIAEKDLGCIWDYISQDNPMNAFPFLLEIEEKILGLSTFPDRHPLIPESEILQMRDYRHLIHKNYRIVYRYSLDTVYVLRIFHGSKFLDLS